MAVSLIEKIAFALFANDDKWAKTHWGYAPDKIKDMFRSDAQAALTAIMGEGDGVQEVDREIAEQILGLPYGITTNGTAKPIPVNRRELGAEMIARHRSTAAAAERARIVAWLRECDKEWDYTYPNLLAEAAEQIEVGEHMSPADAIEAGEV